MKKLIVLLFVVSAFTSCKTKDPEPRTAAEAVSGTYDLTSFKFGSGADILDIPKMPFTQSGKTISGTIGLIRVADDTVDMKITLEFTGEQPESFDLDGLEVRKKSEGYGLYIDGELVADADGQNIIFDYSEIDADTGATIVLRFIAEK
ncbi:hypothetical protein [Persicitalea jodogahamensis]|uniref:Uncharacterized protein n=1 Tax=Persicitalea jodogahamensis TaxID=402147 RepID=A0A8J3GBA8_9BACT|nr:hypothetical protein [Persicitalea jodogahamensis]GHB76269.1 hypothetical protein GCM10007390_32710 [Persicitalea jodogahamensis]